MITNDINHNLEIEDLWVEMSIGNRKKRDNYIIGVVYRHPGGSVKDLDYFTKKLEHIMMQANTENKKCIILGDLNIDGLKINTNDHVGNFFKTVMEQDFVPSITIPTRVVDTSVSIIDHIIVNRDVLKNGVKTGNLYCGITDHLPNFIMINSQIKVVRNVN